MRGPGIFHPNFFYAPRRSLSTTQLADINIYRLSPDGGEWIPGVGLQVTPDVKVWSGKGRVQPNKDWRARPREVQHEYDGVQAVRVQIPIGKNLVGATWDEDEGRYTAYGPDPKFIKDLRVEIIGGPVSGFELMEGDNLFVRNAIQNQNLWLYNLLCDVKTGGTVEFDGG